MLIIRKLAVDGGRSMI